MTEFQKELEDVLREIWDTECKRMELRGEIEAFYLKQPKGYLDGFRTALERIRDKSFMCGMRFN